jgi:multidrug transporter EmrE-like cation transporter
MAWIYFVLISAVGYIGIAVFNRMVGAEAESLYDAVGRAVQPTALVIMIVANIFLGAGVYYGFMATSSAIPIMLSLGVVTTFVFSVMILGVSLTLTKVLGLMLVVAGIYLLK